MPDENGHLDPEDGQLKSCISEKTIKSNRSDRLGNKVDKSERNHKITFVDQIDKKPIAEVREVRAYKNDKQGCGCSLM